MNRVQQICSALRTARRMTLGLVADFPHDRWIWQGFEGQNHVAWTCMHLVLSDDWGPTSVGQPEKRFVERWEPRVSAGPDPDPAAWPSPDEILEMMAQAHTRYLSCLEALTDDDLAHPTQGPLAEYAPVLGTLVDSHVWHEGFHGGQIAVIRKALKLPPAWG